MKNFEYNLPDPENFKTHLKNSFKLIYRRPIYSFVPYIILSFVLSEVILSNLSNQFILFFIISIIAFVVPLCSFEFSYSNDFSKLPFNNFNEYKNYNSLKMFYFIIGFIVLFLLSMYFIISLIDFVIESFFTVSRTVNENELKFKNIDKSGIFIMLFSLMVILICTATMLMSYYLLLFVYLLIIPYKINDLKEDTSFIFLDMVSSKMIIGSENLTIKYIFIFSLIHSFSFLLFIYDYKILFVIAWTFISSIGASFFYLIAKEMSGGGTKTEEKKSVLREIGILKVNSVH